MERKDIKVGGEYLVRLPDVGLRRVRVVADRGFGSSRNHHGWTADVTSTYDQGHTVHIRAAAHIIRECPDATALGHSLEEIAST